MTTQEIIHSIERIFPKSWVNLYRRKKRDSIAYAYKALSYESNNEHLKSNLDLCFRNTSDIELIQ